MKHKLQSLACMAKTSVAVTSRSTSLAPWKLAPHARVAAATVVVAVDTAAAVIAAATVVAVVAAVVAINLLSQSKKTAFAGGFFMAKKL
jgi:hypothetical protein